MIIAKPIVDNEFWLLQDEDNNKIGSMVSVDNEYKVVINQDVRFYKSLKDIPESIEFIKFGGKTKQVNFDFPTVGEPHNILWDLSKSLPLYTKCEKSSCFYAAGWYLIEHDGKWNSVLCPKYIKLKRNKFMGPFKENPHDSH